MRSDAKAFGKFNKYFSFLISDEIVAFSCLLELDRVKLAMKIICPLCSNKAEKFYADTQNYFRCQNCEGIFVDKADLISTQKEKKVYEQHNIDTDDKGYRKFVSPITNAVLKDFTTTSKGLDFGAGRSCIIGAVLNEKKYTINNYDPLFCNDETLLSQKYDFISSCEVVEHFYKPYKEFKLLKSMLQEGGKIYIMTELYDESAFSSWYYKNDPTHVFFYTQKTFQWIKKEFGFKSLSIEKRLVILN